MNETTTNPNPGTGLLVIGIDSGDRHLIRQWTGAGLLSNFSRLFATAAWGDSGNPTGMVAGTVWPTFYMGILPGRTGRFRGTTQFVAGTYRHADIDRERFAFPTFWNVLSRAGRKSTIIDAPYAFLSTEPNVTQLVDWCSHSAWKDGATISSPPELAATVKAQFGRDPVGKCDFAPLTNAAEFRHFRDGLIERISRKTDFTLQQIAMRKTDLLMNVYSECHCAGHQLWHVHDPSHPLHDPALLQELGGDPVLAVYQAMDTALGRLLDGVDPQTRVMVFCSHGIGPGYTGTHLLDEMLLRIEGLKSPRRRQSLAQSMVASWTRMPQAVRTRLTPLQKRLWPGLKAGLVQPGKGRRQFFEIIINDASGGVRLNVRGREPEGIVDPGVQYDEICSMLTRELLAVRNPQTGQPLVARVLKTRDLYGGEHVNRLPDLMVIWNRAGPIGTAESDRIGLISRKFVFRNHRTGDHTEDDGLFFVLGPGIEPQALEKISVADLGPTITAMLGTEFDGVDGRPIEALIDR